MHKKKPCKKNPLAYLLEAYEYLFKQNQHNYVCMKKNPKKQAVKSNERSCLAIVVKVSAFQPRDCGYETYSGNDRVSTQLTPVMISVKDIHISLKLFNHKWAKINMLKLNVNL
jgi:hypothetical protein